MRILIGMVVLFAAAAVCTGADKIDPAKLVGKWKGQEKGENLNIEFTKDGKFSSFMDGSKEEKIEGTYKLENEKLMLESKVLTITIIIIKLTDDELVGVPEGTKNEKTFTRVKPKK